MDKCCNCQKRLTYEDFMDRRCTDWEDVCIKCRELPETKGRWAILDSQEKVRRENYVKKLQHNEG